MAGGGGVMRRDNLAAKMGQDTRLVRAPGSVGQVPPKTGSLLQHRIQGPDPLSLSAPTSIKSPPDLGRKLLFCGLETGVGTSGSSGHWHWVPNPSLAHHISLEESGPPNLDLCVFQLLSHGQFFATPWTAVSQAPLSMGFSRQEYWSELPFPSPGYLPKPRDRTRVTRNAGRLFTI